MEQRLSILEGLKGFMADEVRKGCHWLVGQGLGFRIDQKQLNMKSCKECILGQIVGDYWQAVHQYKIYEGANYGFNIADCVLRHMSPDQVDKTYIKLKKTWIKALNLMAEVD